MPKDKYYLYGKIQLYVDREGFLGAWSRKFSWNGELLGDYVALGIVPSQATAADGSKEWVPAAGSSYYGAMNLKMDRATVTGFPLKERERATTETRIPLDPVMFDYTELQKRGK
ncbi:MAG: hypothetical protein ACREQQ_12470 [Candidatus Binatia bacterium]